MAKIRNSDALIIQLQLEIEKLKEYFRELVFARTAVLGPPKEGDWPRVFVLMPFAESLQSVYDDHIKKVALSLNVRIGRADDFFGSDSIMKDIWSAIHAADVIIADCTGRNPNVFYEIGLAHAIGRQTILISQSLDDVPADLRHLRVIIYKYMPREIVEFEDKLSRTVQTVISKKTISI
jgi:hypothetical protein